MFLTYFSKKYSCYLAKYTIFALTKSRMQAIRILNSREESSHVMLITKHY